MLLFGRVTYEMMEAGWRSVAETGKRPDWMESWMVPFAHTIHATRKVVVSSTLERVDWNAELLRGDLETAVRRLKEQPGEGIYTGGVTCRSRSPNSASSTSTNSSCTRGSLVTAPVSSKICPGRSTSNSSTRTRTTRRRGDAVRAAAVDRVKRGKARRARTPLAPRALRRGRRCVGPAPPGGGSTRGPRSTGTRSAEHGDPARRRRHLRRSHHRR